MGAEVAFGGSQICHGRSPACRVRVTAGDITRNAITVEMPHLDESIRRVGSSTNSPAHLDGASCPLQSVNTSPFVAGSTPKGSRAGVNVSTSLVVVRQCIAISSFRRVEAASLGLTRVINASRRSVVRHGVLDVIPDPFVNVDFPRVGPVAVRAAEPERGPRSLTVR